LPPEHSLLLRVLWATRLFFKTQLIDFQFFSKNIAAPISIKKGQLFDHSSSLFSSDVPHRTQKDGSTDQKLPAFLIGNRWLSFYFFKKQKHDTRPQPKFIFTTKISLLRATPGFI
jgi:hypothetical protein